MIEEHDVGIWIDGSIPRDEGELTKRLAGLWSLASPDAFVRFYCPPSFAGDAQDALELLRLDVTLYYDLGYYETIHGLLEELTEAIDNNCGPGVHAGWLEHDPGTFAVWSVIPETLRRGR